MKVGQVFAERFRMGEVIGEGGMGIVFRAVDIESGAEMALKCLRPEYAKKRRDRRRFLREARAINRLNHPNIVEMYGYGEDADGTLYIAMELLTGTPMSTLRTQRLELDVLLDLVDQVLAALAYSHAKGVVHRDVKPENILVEGIDGGKRPQAKLLDFGFARVEEDSDEHLTQGRADGFGTPQYMAPEQASGKGEVGPWTDLYAMGVILFEFIAGRPPFSGAHGMAVALKHLMEPVPALVPRVGLVVPAGVEEIVRRCLEKAPGARYQDAGELRRALRPYGTRGREALPSVDGVVAEAAGLIASLAAGAAREAALAAPVEAAEASADCVETPWEEREAYIIGRDEELAWLWDNVRAVVEGGEARVVLMSRARGMGLTAMLHWLSEHVAEGGWMRAVGGAFDGGQTELRGALEGLFGGLPMELDLACQHVRALTGRWLGVAGTSVEKASALDALGVPAIVSFMRSEKADSSSERGLPLFDRLIATLRLAAQTQPVLLSLEAIEYARADTHGFLLQLVSAIAEAPFPIMVVGSYTGAEGTPPDSLAHLVTSVCAIRAMDGRPLVQTRHLGALSRPDVATMLCREVPLSVQTAEAIAEHVQGNPLHGRELVRLLQQRGQLSLHDGRLSLPDLEPPLWAGGAARSSILEVGPEGLGETMWARARGTLTGMGHVGLGERVLELAAILGRGFEYGLLLDFLERVLGHGEQIEAAVETLLKCGLLVESRGPGQDRLHFAHSALAHAIRSLQGNRSVVGSLHRTAAEAMIAQHGAHIRQVARDVAGHFEAGGAPDLAALYYAQAAGYAKDEGFIERAFAWLDAGDRILAVMPGTAAARQRARLWLAIVELELDRAGDERAQDLAVRVHRWGRERGEDALVGRASMALSQLLSRQGRPEDALRGFNHAAGLFERVGDRRRTGQAVFEQARLVRAQGDDVRAQQLYEAAGQKLKSMGAHEDVAKVWHGLGELALRRGDYQVARRELTRAADAYEGSGARSGKTFCEWLLGETCRVLLDLDAAHAHFLSAREGYAFGGDRLGLGRCDMSLARILAGRGQAVEAMERYELALLAYKGLGDASKVGATQLELGLFAVGVGENARGLRGLGEALRLVRATGDRDSEVRVRVGLGLAEYRRGEVASARAEVKAAAGLDGLQRVVEPGMASHLEQLGVLELRAGDTTRAIALFRWAQRICHTLGDEAGWQRLGQQLAGLGVPQ